MPATLPTAADNRLEGQSTTVGRKTPGVILPAPT
jgi:hypothetical protein